MATQKALLVTEIGKPVILVHDHPIPQPGPQQVQVKVSVAGLNPHDQRSRDWGLLIADKLPYILGKDVVGTVSALGSGVQNFAIGDRVMSMAENATQSGLQEYCVADLVNCAKIPDGMGDEDAVTIPTNLSSVWAALFDVLDLPAPWVQEKAIDQLLIVGGGSNTGRFAVQLAKLASIPKIVVVGGDEAELKSLGAADVVDRHGPETEVLKRVRDIVGDDLVYALDVVNFPPGLSLALKSLSGSQKGKLARLVPMGEVEEKYGHEVLDVLGNMLYRRPACVELWERLTGLIEKGDIKATPHDTKGTTGVDEKAANEALDGYRDGTNKLKPQIRI